MTEMPMSERSFAERYRLAGLSWTEAKHHATNMSDQAKYTDDLKKPKFEAIKRAIRATIEGPVSDSALEREALVSDAWSAYLEEIHNSNIQANEAWKLANMARVEMDAIDMAHREWASRNALRREEMNLHRGM